MRPILLTLLATSALAQSAAPLKRAESTITAPHILAHIRTLASDDYTGRHPGTPGETKSVAYIIAQAKAIGLAPGSPTAIGGASWTQPVPFYGMLPDPTSTVTLTAGSQSLPFKPGTDYTAWSAQPDPIIDLQPTPIVFVGYGVVAPEYHWDDYAGVDVKGKTVMLLSGEPTVMDATDPTKADDSYFMGRALTVHGRTGSKFEQAFRHGASAVILVVAGGPLSPTALFQNYTREILTLRDGNAYKRPAALTALLPGPAAALVAAAGADFAALRAAASRPGFRPVQLSAQAEFHIRSKVRQFESSNVVAKIPGSDPKLKDEIVVYSAHWDHHGQTVANGETRTFHGASDNAAGTAGILEIARAFKTLHPRRTILFLWPTAEEKGLLGAAWYVDHPLYPLDHTVADINLDYFSNWGWGPTRDFSIVGIGNSTLDDLAADAVRAQGRTLTGDTAPEQGFYFRSDHLEFNRGGVPSIETSPGIDYIGQPADFGPRMRTQYIQHDYHQPTDQIKPDWNLAGAVQDLKILLDIGYRAAQSDTRPTFKPNAIWLNQVLPKT
jgi:Zn-dependent M28 family amino/carboxypeptidase